MYYSRIDGKTLGYEGYLFFPLATVLLEYTKFRYTSTIVPCILMMTSANKVYKVYKVVVGHQGRFDKETVNHSIILARLVIIYYHHIKSSRRGFRTKFSIIIS
jgi:hypothetical protein